MSKAKTPQVAEAVYSWVNVPLNILNEAKPKGKKRPQSIRDYEINKAVGSEIKRLRKLKGLTVIELSNKLSITQAQLSYYENAQDSVNIAILHDLADVLEVKPKHFLNIANNSF